MRVMILGANGATGRLLTEKSLARGYEVTALLRHPAQFAWREQVRVVEGSVFDSGTVERAFEGADAVLSALGAHSPLRNENVLPRAVPVIVRAMQSHGPRRIVALGSAGARDDSMKRQPAWRTWFVKNLLYPTVLKWPVYEQLAQYRLFFESGLDWTMPLPPMLTNGPERKKYRIDAEALPPGAYTISRADVAEFMLQQVESPEWVRQGVYICY